MLSTEISDSPASTGPPLTVHVAPSKATRAGLLSAETSEVVVVAAAAVVVVVSAATAAVVVVVSESPPPQAAATKENAIITVSPNLVRTV